MPTTFADALSPLAKRMPRAVRDIEILRVSAQLDSADFDAAATKARSAALAWANRRAGGALPKDAWDFQEFELLAGGRNSAAVRISDDVMDLWALRAEDPDKEVAGRIWSTEVVVGGEVGKHSHLSVRLIVSTAEPDFSIEPHVPGLVLQMIEAPGLVRGPRKLLAVPRLIQTENDAEDLCDHLEDPDRRLPIFVVVVPQGAAAISLIDDSAVARATAGLARNFRVPEDLSWVLTNRFGKYRSVFNGGVRAYLPGFSATDDPYRHRLFLGENLRDTEYAQTCATWMRKIAADVSISATRLGKEVLDFASVRTASRRVKSIDLSKRAAPDAELLETARQLVESLESQVSEKEKEIDGYVELTEAAEARALRSGRTVRFYSRSANLKMRWLSAVKHLLQSRPSPLNGPNSSTGLIKPTLTVCY